MSWAYDATYQALAYTGEVSNKIQEIIDTQDEQRALEFCEEHGILMPITKQKLV